MGERARDEMWRLQSQLCKFISPSEYDVPKEYYRPNLTPKSNPNPNGRKDSSNNAVCDAISSEFESSGNATSNAPSSTQQSTPHTSPSSSYTYITLKTMLPASVTKEPNLTSTLDEHIVDDNYMSRTPEKSNSSSSCPESDRGTGGQGHPDLIDDSDTIINRKLIVTGEEGIAMYVCT